MNKKNKIGIAISAIFIVLILWNIDAEKLINTFKYFNYKVLLLFVPLYILSLYIRGIRWKYLLCKNPKLSKMKAFASFATSNAINSYLPARMGDFWRAIHIGNEINESKAKLLGSIILERILDGISVVLILVFAIIFYCKQQWILNIAYISASIFIFSLITIFFILKYKVTDKIFDFLSVKKMLSKHKTTLEKIKSTINNLINGFEVMEKPKYFTIAILTSILAWGIECIITYILISGFSINAGYSIAMFVISFVALSTVIPSSSIFIGPYQYAYTLALSIYHIEKSNGLAISFIHQISIMLIISIIAAIYFSVANINIKKIKHTINEEI